MRLTLEQKMKMCEEHVLKGKSISHASDMYGGYNVGNLKYLINIYKRYGKRGEEVHHIQRLKVSNVKDTSISLYLDNLELFCREYHNKEHKRFSKSQDFDEKENF